MSRSALVETLTAAATAMLGAALASGCGDSQAANAPPTAEIAHVQVVLPTGKQIAAEPWRSFVARTPDALQQPATHVEVDGGAVMFFERSKAYVFLTADEDRALPRGEPVASVAGADCCTDLGLVTIDCSGIWCNCQATACSTQYPGRPFVVENATRVAGVEPRDGWA